MKKIKLLSKFCIKNRYTSQLMIPAFSCNSYRELPPSSFWMCWSQWKGECSISGQASLLIHVSLWFSAKWGWDASGWCPVSHCSSQCGQQGPFSCLSPARTDEMESLVCLCGKLSWTTQAESRGNYPSIWGKCVFFWPKYLKNYLNLSFWFDYDDLDTSFCLYKSISFLHLFT